MRNIFADELYRLAVKDKDIFIVVADISPAGNMIKFQKKYPERFINVGVSEQTMIGVCAGLALQNKKVFAYTIATFTLYRPFEMVRNDLCYQNLPVTIVGMGAGTIYNNLGATHQTQEDISVARSIPNMQIIAPSEPDELKLAVRHCVKNRKGPIYLRIGKSGEKNYNTSESEKWKFGKIRKLKNGKDLCILTYGPIIKISEKIINKLKEKNIKCAQFSCHTLKPFDFNTLKKIFSKFKLIITIEDHSEIGGLSSIIKQSAYDNGYKGEIVVNALKDKFIHSYADQENFLKKNDISEDIIYRKILKKLK